MVSVIQIYVCFVIVLLRVVISAAVMDVVLAVSENSQMILDNWRAILDTCATVTLIPTNCAECLGLPIMPHTNGRRVGTADQHGNFTIQGWVELPALYQSVTDISHRSDTIYLQRSISPLPAQTCHVSFSPRPEIYRKYPVSQSGALRKIHGPWSSCN